MYVSKCDHLPLSTNSCIDALSAHPSQVRGRNKFEHFTHPWMPPPVPAWDWAMGHVDLSIRARSDQGVWGHWFPEPALLVRPATNDRRDRYFFTWLRLRSAWMYLVRHPGSRVTSVTTFLPGIFFFLYCSSMSATSVPFGPAAIQHRYCMYDSS